MQGKRERESMYSESETEKEEDTRNEIKEERKKRNGIGFHNKLLILHTILITHSHLQ